jgi:hypothetical protein
MNLLEASPSIALKEVKVNTVHADGQALNKLSRQVKNLYESGSSSPRKTAGKKADAKPHHVQRQDTDYDVKPSIAVPTTARKSKPAAPRRAKSDSQQHAVDPDSDLPDQANQPRQMGESEGQDNNWIRHHQLREKQKRSQFR